ncbi:MAG: NADH-quinone oxidoreductase subunit J [Deinococcota bacterium]
MIVGAVGVITLKQPVHAALSLVGTLLTLATIYVGLEAHFLASIQVIVYAGAIMVLFLFVIMLLNIQQDPGPGAFKWLRPAAYGVAVVVGLALIAAVTQNTPPLPAPEIIDATLAGGGPEAIGTALFRDFVLAFQLVGVLLLTGIIGAVSLVQRKAVSVQEAETERPLEAVSS